MDAGARARWAAIALGATLAAGTVGLYLPSAGNGFVYDDRLLILKAEPPRSLGDLADLATRQYYRGLVYYRPFTSASFLAQRLWTGDDPRPFHVANALLAGGVALAVFAFLSRRRFALGAGPAALATALFVAHPVFSSCVHPISGRDTLLAIGLTVLALHGLLGASRLSRGAGLLAFAVGLGCKESVVAVPVILAVADLAGLGGSPPRGRAAWIRRYAPVAAILLGYLAVRAVLFQGGELHPGRPLDVPLTWIYLIQTTLVPFRSLLYEPPVGAWLSPPRLLVAAAVLVAAATAARRAWPSLKGPVLFWCGWIVASQIPTANLVWQETRFDERYAAVGSLGLVVGLATIAAVAVRRGKRLAAVAGVVAVAVLSAVSYGRGSAFEEIAFYRQWIEIKSGESKPHYNLAIALSDRGRFDEALVEYRKALAIAPDDSQIHNNLGQTLAKAGDPTGALAAFRDAVRLDPTNAQAQNNLGSALALTGDLQGAVTRFREAVRLDPRYVNALFDLGYALMVLGDDAEAEVHLREALRLDPEYAKAREALATLTRRRPGPGDADNGGETVIDDR